MHGVLIAEVNKCLPGSSASLVGMSMRCATPTDHVFLNVRMFDAFFRSVTPLLVIHFCMSSNSEKRDLIRPFMTFRDVHVSYRSSLRKRRRLFYGVLFT